MNANELADLIEKGGKDGFFQDEMVAILRQQQAEIEALKKQLAQANRVYDFDNPLLDKAQEK